MAPTIAWGCFALRRASNGTWVLSYKDHPSEGPPIIVEFRNLVEEEIDELRAMLVAFRILDEDGQQ